jgi:hypothetical protein
VDRAPIVVSCVPDRAIVLRPAPDKSRDQGDNEQHDEYEEKDLRNFTSAGGDAAKTEQCGDQGDDKKD